jgi:hypothetical protein
MDVMHPSETTIYSQSTWRCIPEYGKFHTTAVKKLQTLQQMEVKEKRQREGDKEREEEKERDGRKEQN